MSNFTTIPKMGLDEIYNYEAGKDMGFFLCAIASYVHICIWGPTGNGKTKGLEHFVRTVPPEVLQKLRPELGDIKRTYQIDMNMAVTDENENGGLLATDFASLANSDGKLKPSQPEWAETPAFAQQRTQPRLFQQLDWCAKPENDDTMVFISIDEINAAGITQFQFMSMESSGYIGEWRIPENLRKRIVFVYLGNRPEDNPFNYELVGPFAGRVWHVTQEMQAREAIAYLDTTAEGCHPALGDVFDAKAHWLNVHHVTATGHKIPLASKQDMQDSGQRQEELIELVNGFSPRRLEQTNRFMHQIDRMGVDMMQAQKMYRCGMPEEIAVALTTERALMEHITKLDVVLRDPKKAPIPDGIMDQTMQLRYLLPKITEANCDRVLTYLDRLEDHVLSIVRSKMIAIGKEVSAQQRQMHGNQGDASIDVSALKGWTPKLIGKVRAKFHTQWQQNLVGTMGKGVVNFNDDATNFELPDLPDFSELKQGTQDDDETLTAEATVDTVDDDDGVDGIDVAVDIVDEFDVDVDVDDSSAGDGGASDTDETDVSNALDLDDDDFDFDFD